MDQATVEKTDPAELAFLLGMPVRHFNELCQKFQIESLQDGRPDLSALAVALCLPDLTPLLGPKKRIFRPLKEVARTLGISPKTLATGKPKPFPLRIVEVSPRVRYVFAPDLDLQLYGEATEVPALDPLSADPFRGLDDTHSSTVSAWEVDLFPEDIEGLMGQ